MSWSFAEALTLGIATAINPCPLAAGIAAVAFLGRRAASPGRVLLAGVLYALGGSLTYVALAAAVLRGMDAVALAWSLQRYVTGALGPILILLGMLLLELIRLPRLGRNLAGRWQARADRWGLWAALPLGVLLALGFCPTSAAFFFGSLLWMAATHHSWLLLPLAYGLGAALPVVLAAGVLAFSARLLGQVFAVTAQVARWGQRIAGTVLIVVGVYFAVRFIFHMF